MHRALLYFKAARNVMIFGPANSSPAMRIGFLGIVIAAASIVVPAVFGKRIDISPLVLFGIIFLSNASMYFIGKSGEDKEAAFSAVFYKRLLVSILFSVLLIGIYSFARGLG